MSCELIFQNIYSLASKTNELWEFWQDVLSGTIGGGIGGIVSGLLVYLVVYFREKKRDEKVQKSACTNALLKIQTTLIFQKQELKGLKKLCENILDIKISNVTLGNLLKNTTAIDEKMTILKMATGNNLTHPLEKAIHTIITKPLGRFVIEFPYEILNMEIKLKEKDPKETNPGKRAKYLQDIESCNKGYMEIFSLVEHRNEIRNMMINQPNLFGKINDNFFSIVAKTAELSFELIKKIKELSEKIDSIDVETGEYIKILGLSDFIQQERYEQGNNIYNGRSDV